MESSSLPQSPAFLPSPLKSCRAMGVPLQKENSPRPRSVKRKALISPCRLRNASPKSRKLSHDEVKTPPSPHMECSPVCPVPCHPSILCQLSPSPRSKTSLFFRKKERAMNANSSGGYGSGSNFGSSETFTFFCTETSMCVEPKEKPAIPFVRERGCEYSRLRISIPEDPHLEQIVSGSTPVVEGCDALRASPAPAPPAFETGTTFSASWRQGSRRTMEDTFCAVPFLQQNAQTGFFGVFDGHGPQGAHVAKLAASSFKSWIHDKGCQTAIATTFDEAFTSADSACAAGNTNGGTTAVVAHVNGESRTLHVAHVGDSRCVLSRQGAAHVLSQDHTPEREDEKARVEKAGGHVLFVKGLWRVDGELSITRAIGDLRKKKYVCASPEITKELIGEHDDYLIMATDGLWSVMSNQEAVDIVKRSGSPHAASESLVEEALAKGSSDNVCVVVVDLRRYLTNSPSGSLPSSSLPSGPIATGAQQPLGTAVTPTPQ